MAEQTESITYTGPFPGVITRDGIEFEQGKSRKVDADTAKRLCHKGGDFSATKSAVPTKTDTAKVKE